VPDHKPNPKKEDIIAPSVEKKEKHRGIFGSVIYELWKTGKQPLLIAILSGIALLIIIPILTYLYFVRDFTSKENVISRKNAGVLLTDRNDKPFFTFYEAASTKSIPFSEIPEVTKQAAIATEDRDFYNHTGFSIRGIGRAVVANLRSEELTQGGSTITQQLVKNTLLSQEKSFLRKYQELFLAIELERRFSKNDILEMYLNTAYFGEGAFGVEDASHAYFSKNASQLTLGESALLIGILPAPSALSPLSGDKEAALRHQKSVLQKMVDQGYITPELKTQAESQVITFNPQKSDLNVEAPHFALMVKNELIKKYGEQRISHAGFRVKTTIDLPLQEYAERMVKNQVTRLAFNQVTNGATVVLDPKTGEILALVGSHNWYDEVNGKINLATTPRQPGSSFKPIVYAKALEEREITPATVLEDKPITYPGGYKPKNYDGRFRQKVLARFALAGSLNIPTLHVMERVGVPGALDMAERLGITSLKSPSDYGLSLALGAGEVPLLELTGAFAVFANNGQRIEPTTIISIADKRDSIIYTHAPTPTRVLSEDVAFQISSILSDNAARSEVFGNALTISRQAAVKTGTTEDYRDALTVGYTPQVVIGVWIGNNDRKPMDNVAGSLGAAPIWRLLMEQYLRGKPIQRFTPPPGIIRENVCKENGLRAETATSSAYAEFFIRGTLPKGSCTNGGSFPGATDEPEQKPTERPQQNDEDEEPNNQEPTTTPLPTQEVTPSPTPLINLGI